MSNHLAIDAELNNLAAIRAFVQEKLTLFGANPTLIEDLVLAVNEAATNVMVHGYKGMGGQLEIVIEANETHFLVTLRDDAPPFNPTIIPSPDLNLPLHERPLGGMGIHLMRSLTTAMQYRGINGNEVTLMREKE